LARQAEISEWAVRRYASEGLIEHKRDSSGRRLFSASLVPVVRAIYAQRIASRGRKAEA
jgi:DNA-binding transcriptional MerR regulator